MIGVSLNAVRAALKSSQSEHAAHFTSLIDSRDLSPYKSKDIAKRKLGSDGTEYPTLGKLQSPSGLRKPQSLKDLQEICLRDLSEARKHFEDRFLCFLPSRGTDYPTVESNVDAGMHTIDTLTDPKLGVADTVVSFPSRTLDELCNEDWSLPENCLHAAMTTCTVLPKNTNLPLQHSNEGTTVTTLLSGSIIWGIWPPTLKNIRTLQVAYERFAENYDDAKLDVAGDLEGGLTFVQGEGDGLRIPPFSIMMGLATTTSVLATRTHVTSEDLVSVLEKLPLLQAWFQTEVNGDRKQSEFNASIIRHLNLLLNGDPENDEYDELKLARDSGGLLERLLSIWDGVKDDLAAIMEPADGEVIKDIWTSFLISAVGRQCQLCNKRISNKTMLMKTHFIDRHWPKAKESEREDPKGAQGIDAEDTGVPVQSA
jgi:hypothetical protein